MEERHTRFSYRQPARCQLLFTGRRSAGILMAIPFIFCFALFGIFNLIGGTVLTMMACKPKFPPQTMILVQKLLRNYDQKLDTSLDPMKVVGGILLLTGSLLVVVGILLGIVACRSVNVQHKNRESCSLSGIQMSSLNGPTTSFQAGSTSSRTRKKSSHFTGELKSPILEVNSEEEEDISSSANGAPPRCKIEHQPTIHMTTTFIEGPQQQQEMDIGLLSWREDISDQSPKVTWTLSVSDPAIASEKLIDSQESLS